MTDLAAPPPSGSLEAIDAGERDMEIWGSGRVNGL